MSLGARFAAAVHVLSAWAALLWLLRTDTWQFAAIVAFIPSLFVIYAVFTEEQRLWPVLVFGLGGGLALESGFGAALGLAVHSSVFGPGRALKLFRTCLRPANERREFVTERHRAASYGGTWPENIHFSAESVLNAAAWSSERLVRALEPHLHGARVARSRMEELRRTLHPEELGTCLSYFIGAELDWRTPRRRGLGRASDFVPRLGSLGPKQFFAMGGGRRHAADLIMQVVLDGYMSLWLLENDGLEGPKLRMSPPELAKMWVPGIYAVSFSSMGKPFEVAELHATASVDVLLAYLKSKGVSGPKVRLACHYYVLAGWSLRLAQLDARPRSPDLE